MKKLSVVFVALAAVLFMASCGGSDKKEAAQGGLKIENPTLQWNDQDIAQVISANCTLENYSVKSGNVSGSVDIPIVRLKIKLLQPVAELSDVNINFEAHDNDGSIVRYLGKRSHFRIFDIAQEEKFEKFIKNGKAGDVVELKFRMNVKELNVDAECKKVKEAIKCIYVDRFNITLEGENTGLIF
ncbi:MAG: hypothetical protein J6Q73_09435 [Bacteroidaceae bacterium]|nr:hypothetical protein [Bacteroidaceae bacterium]